MVCKAWRRLAKTVAAARYELPTVNRSIRGILNNFVFSQRTFQKAIEIWRYSALRSYTTDTFGHWSPMMLGF